MSATARMPLDAARAFELDAPRAYSGVRTRRMAAFLVDYALVLLLWVPAAFVVAILGIVTFGFGWALYAVLLPLVAVLYVAFTLGGRRQATPGMRLADIRLARRDGAAVDPVFATLHFVLFWAGNVVLTPFILLVALLTPRKQLLHDLLLGTVVVRDRS